MKTFKNFLITSGLVVVAAGFLRFHPLEVLTENRELLERVASRALVPYGTETFRGRSELCSDEIIPFERNDELFSLVSEAANRYSLDRELVLAVIHAESNFNPKARSHKGALGLMQLMPATAQWLGVSDPLCPQQNVLGGSKYLAGLLGQFNGDLELALAAYNAGPGTVYRYNRNIPPFRETRNYVRKVMCNYRKLLSLSV